MRNLLILLSAITLLASCSNKALEYNNQLITQQYNVADEINSYLEFIKNTHIDSITTREVYKTRLESLKENVISEIQKSKEQLSLLGNFQDNETFNSSLMEVMSSYERGIENEYYKLATYNLLADSLQTPQLYATVVQDALTIDSIIGAAEQTFIQEQIEFSIQQNVPLDNQ